MGISYDSGSRRWNLEREQETFERKPVNSSLTFSITGYYGNEGVGTPNSRGVYPQYIRVFYPQDPPQGGKGQPPPPPRETITITLPISEDAGEFSNNLENALRAQNVKTNLTQSSGRGFSTVVYPTIASLRSSASKLNQDEFEASKRNAEINAQYEALEKINKAKNKGYDTILSIASTTQGGDYVAKRDAFRSVPLGLVAAGLSQNEINTFKDSLVNSYKTFYITEKLQQWNPALGAKPPYGDFDPNYYKSQNPAAVQQWQSAVANDDIDITLRYGENGYYLQHYTTQGKPAGVRGNRAETLAAAEQYLERKPTDAELAQARTLQLDPEIENAVNVAVGEKMLLETKQFGALTQDVLKDTIEQMKKAKAREQELAIFSNFDTFGEIVNINKDLTNSILGDSGVGGVLSFMGGKKAQESLEKSLRGITGVNNEITYNWQQWFDDTLKKKYQNDIELGLTKDEAQEQVKIQGQFAREFIDKYLTPRFNESRSMNEFVEYLDVRQAEQNPFQTQDILNAVKLVADLKANQYIEELRKTPERYFNVDFYFNPSGNKAREGAYAAQAQTVNADWDAAKNGDPYWASQAYRFGVNVNDKDAFARMHFQVKGQGRGYDPADDILNASKVSDYIYSNILPALNKEASAQGTVFGQFVRPEEFADEMLKGLDPNNKTTWSEVLKKYGLEDFNGTINDLKEYITETIRTGSAQEIREQIKYLNEKREKPTQEILGISYIQREEDYKPKESGNETELYRTFQSAGFKGTEDEFYESFFPDLDRSEQVALTKAGRNQELKTTGLDFSDPFASLGTIESLFGEEQQEKETKKSSYFTIDEDEELPTKTKAGQGFLDEFTSLFKGFS